MAKPMNKRIWIAWETHRRTIELARSFGCKLHIVEYHGISRYPKCIIKSLHILLKRDYTIAFVQNPSMILALLACIVTKIVNKPIIVDRHTTFLLNARRKYIPRRILLRVLSYVTIRLANITIVTNDYLAELVKKDGGRPFVLPDKIPVIRPSGKVGLEGKTKLLLISSFGKDEPVAEVINAVNDLEAEGIVLYITGDYKKLDPKIYQKASANIHFTGFMPESEFNNMLFSVDVVLALTKSDYVMLCGCYEAVAAEKPLVTSHKKVLLEYFTRAVFTDNEQNSIRENIRRASREKKKLKGKMVELKKELEENWKHRGDMLEKQVKEIELGYRSET